MAVVSADYTTVVTTCRSALAKGGNVSGADLIKIIDVVQHAANTLDAKATATTVTMNTDADALEASLVTHIALWAAVGAGDSSTVYTNAIAAWAPLRTALIASANAALAAGAVGITNVTANDTLDGRAG